MKRTVNAIRSLSTGLFSKINVPLAKERDSVISAAASPPSNEQESVVVRRLGKEIKFYDNYSYLPSSRVSLRSSYIKDYIEKEVNMNLDSILTSLDGMNSYKNKLFSIKSDDVDDGYSPYWNQYWVSPFDAISLYYFLAKKNPRYYVECGSGNSTKFAAQSIRDNNLRTKIISIDPYPRSEIDQLCKKIYRFSLEDMKVDFFRSLTSEDLFVIDSSHRSLTNSDVTTFFMEILPILPSGLMYSLHDIYLPNDYPPEWDERIYNEQYLLASYLCGGAMNDKLLFPGCFVCESNSLMPKIHELWGEGSPFSHLSRGCTFFWMEKS